MNPKRSSRIPSGKKQKPFPEGKSKGGLVKGMNWPLLGAGLAASLIGIHFNSGFHPQWSIGVPFHFLGALAVYLSFPRLLFSAVGPSSFASSPKKSKTHKDLGWLWPILALALGQIAFRMGSLAGGWILSLAGLVAAAWFLSQKDLLAERTSEESFRWTNTFWLVLAYAAILRFAFVGTYVTGLQGDEANNIVDTLGISQGTFEKGPFVMGWGGTPVFPDYIVGYFFKLLGEKVWVARFVSSLASLGTLVVFFRWCRFWMGERASVLASFFMANSWWFFYFSLSPFHNSILFFFQVSAFCFLERGFRKAGRGDFWWAGFFAALSVMNYVPGRSVPLAIFLTFFATGILRGWTFLRFLWKPLALSGLAFFLVISPYLIFAMDNPTEFWGRVDPRWISQEYQSTGNYFFLLKSYFLTLSSLWTPNPSVDLRFAPVALPFVDPFAGAFAFLGFGMVLFTLRKPASWVLIPAVFFGLSANALARMGWPTDLAYLHSIRFSILIPFLFLASGWGLEWTFRSIESSFPKGESWSRWFLAVLVAGSLATNEPIFVPGFNKDKGSWGEHGLSQIELAKFILEKTPDHQFLGDSDILSNTVTFLVHEKTNVKWLFLDKDIPIPYRAQKNVMLLFAPWRITEVQKEKIRSTYPQAQWGEIKTPWGDPYVTTVDIPLEAVEASQKAMKVNESLP
jgi:hypothetical protein